MSGLYIPLDTPDGSRTEHAENLLAPNPSYMTLDGTNTWVIGADEVVVVDPGPQSTIAASPDGSARMAGSRHRPADARRHLLRVARGPAIVNPARLPRERVKIGG